MATLKQRLHRKNSNDYDIIHYETSSSICLRQNGEAIENSLNNLPKLKDDNNDPTTMFTLGEIQISPNGTIFIGHNNGIDVYNPNQMYKWKKYNVNTVTTYYWNYYTVTKSYQDKYNSLNQTILNTTLFPTYTLELFTDAYGAFFPRYGSLEYAYGYNNSAVQYYGGTENSARIDDAKYLACDTLSPRVLSEKYFDDVSKYSYVTIHADTGGHNKNKYLLKIVAYPPRDPSALVHISRVYIAGYYEKEEVYNKNSLIGQVNSTSFSDYPTNGYKNGYWYEYSTNSAETSQGSYIEDVYSVNQNAYPDNGIQDGYWYVKQ